MVINDLDRLGRDADDVIRELKELKELGIKVWQLRRRKVESQADQI